jgi:hypothetical protein
MNSAFRTIQDTYSVFRPDQFSIDRAEIWSFQQYPLVGSAQLTMFTQSVGSTGMNLQLTNIQQAGQLGRNSLVVRQIRTEFFIANPLFDQFTTGADVDNFYADLVYGFPQAGVLDFSINQQPFAQFPLPFQFAPPGGGRFQLYRAGLQLNDAAALITPPPMADLNRDEKSVYKLDEGVLIEGSTPFNVTVSFPSGLIPIISTGVVTANNPLFVGVGLVGDLVQPLVG